MTTVGPVRRPSRFAEDYDGLIALMTAVAEADGDGIEVVPDDVRLEYVDEEPGWVRSHLVWEASDGRLAAVSAVWHEVADPQDRAYGSIDIHPDHRTLELEDEVARTFRESTAALAGKPVAARVGAKRSQAWKTGMLERGGFRPDRSYFRMRRPLAEPSDAPSVPEGYTIRPLAGEVEADAWCAAFVEAFADNYDPPTMSPEERRNYAAKPDYLPEGDLVAATADGEIAGLCWALRETDAAGVSRGWIWYIAVREPHRGKGLARALLLRSLEVLPGPRPDRGDARRGRRQRVRRAPPVRVGRLRDLHHHGRVHRRAPVTPPRPS